MKVEPVSVTALPSASIDNAWRGVSLRVAYQSVYPGELRPEVSAPRRVDSHTIGQYDIMSY